MHLSLKPTIDKTGIFVDIYIYIKTHDSESQGQEEAQQRDR